jgi:hypothetical protein
MKLFGEGGAQFSREVAQCLGQDGCAGDDGHEIRVTVPARDDVDMKMFLDACARCAAEIDADVEAVGFHDGREGILAAANEFHEVGEFVVGKAVKVSGLFIRHDHKMTAHIGKAVEERVTGAVAGDDEIGFVIAGLGDLSEKGHARRRWFGGGDVFDSPRRVEHFHGAILQGG